jgi:hypothetical protein
MKTFETGFFLVTQETKTKILDFGSKPAWANSLQDPLQKNLITKKEKRASGVVQDVGPEFKP